MSDKSLEPVDYSDFEKSYKLIGQYLSVWAHMESKIDEAIRIGLHLNILQGSIVSLNAGYTSKCHILQTLVALGKPRKKGNRDENDKLFEKLKNLSSDRNIVAHTQFFPKKTKSGAFAVYFSVIKAKGNFNIPEVTWTETTFEAKFEEMYQLSDRIKEIGNTLSNRALVTALSKYSLDSKPKAGLFQLGAGLPQSPPPQAGLLLGGLLSIPKTTPQTPQESED